MWVLRGQVSFGDYGAGGGGGGGGGLLMSVCGALLCFVVRRERIWMIFVVLGCDPPLSGCSVGNLDEYKYVYRCTRALCIISLLRTSVREMNEPYHEMPVALASTRLPCIGVLCTLVYCCNMYTDKQTDRLTDLYCTIPKSKQHNASG